MVINRGHKREGIDMRLIDADKLKENINGWYSFMRDVRHLPNYTLKQDEIIGKIDMMDTIDAIPKSVLEDIKAEIRFRGLHIARHYDISVNDGTEFLIGIFDKHISEKEQTDGKD